MSPFSSYHNCFLYPSFCCDVVSIPSVSWLELLLPLVVTLTTALLFFWWIGVSLTSASRLCFSRWIAKFLSVSAIVTISAFNSVMHVAISPSTNLSFRWKRRFLIVISSLLWFVFHVLHIFFYFVRNAPEMRNCCLWSPSVNDGLSYFLLVVLLFVFYLIAHFFIAHFGYSQAVDAVSTFFCLLLHQWHCISIW